MIARRAFTAEFFIFVLWSICVLWMISRHAIWADEARAWLIATRTPNWSAMFEQAHADGHPLLWYVFLRSGAFIHSGIETLYVVHFIFAALAVGFCLALTNVPFGLRAILVLGGILGFEFAVVARNYAPAVAAIFAFAFYYPQRQHRPWRLGLLLAFALNVHAGLAPIVPFLLLPWLCETLKGEKWPFVHAAGITVCGYAALLISIYPPDANSIFVEPQINTGYNLLLDILPTRQLMSVLTAGLDDIIELSQGVPFWAITGINAIILFAAFFLFRTLPFRLAGLGVVAGTSLFYGLTYPMPSYRHGALLIVSLVSLMAMEGPYGLQSRKQKASFFIITAVVTLQFARSLFAYVLPFSSSVDVSTILKQPAFASAQLFCLPEWMGQSIAALGHADCHMAFVDRKGPYPLFLHPDYRKRQTYLADILRWMQNQEAEGRPALVYLHRAFIPKQPSEPDDLGWHHRKGRRFKLLATQAETILFLRQIEFLTREHATLSHEGGVLLRLKPEFRGGPSPSAPQRIDR